MAVIAVINRKGGAGKSTVASHLAAYCAMRSDNVALCDLDPQKSASFWLERRPAGSAKIRGYKTHSASSFTHPPANARHVVIDTPSGFEGLEFLRVMLYADAVLVPTAFSFFDRRALEETLRTLQAVPRVAKGKCAIACVGTRFDSRSNDRALLDSMLRGMDVPCLGVIPSGRIYSRCLEQGLTVFDFPSAIAHGQAAHWAGVLAWLDTALSKVAAPPVSRCVPAIRPAAPPPAPAIQAFPRDHAPRPSFAAALMRSIPRFLAR